MNQARKSRGVPTPALRTAHAARANQHSTPRATIVPAVLLRASAGATLDRLLVRSCCWCRFAHVHHVPVGADLGSLLRSPRCAPHRTYRVEVVDVVPAAASTGLGRRAS